MKKLFVALSAALLALAACQKETLIVENGPIDASKLVFNVTVNHPGDTKAVKENWVTGDKIYLFFENNTAAYVTLTSDDGTNRAWTPAISGELDLEHEGEHVTAVYLPFNTDTPTYDGGWKFETKYAYYLKAEGIEYTVTTDPSTDISTLNVSLSMAAPAGFVQFFLPDASPVANKYVLIEDHIIPAGCGVITPGGAVEQVTRLRSSQITEMEETEYGVSRGARTTTEVASRSGYPMEAMTVPKEGYYFYGTLSKNVANPTFYFVEQNPTYKYAIGTHTKSFSGKTLQPGMAVKFASLGELTLTERWVDLGLPRGVKWATGNVSNSGMVNPSQNGDFFPWGETVGYTPSDGAFTRQFHWKTENDKYAFFSRYATLDEVQVYSPSATNVNILYHVWLNKYTKGYHHPLEKKKDSKEGDSLTRLVADDDAATVILGSSWRMGTEREWWELIYNCTRQPSQGTVPPTTGGPHEYINGEGICGMLLRRNGLALFIPAAGLGNEAEGNNYVSGQYRYWSSDLMYDGRYTMAASGLAYNTYNPTNPNSLLGGGIFRRGAGSIRAVYVP